MSHIEKVECAVTDLAALEAAAKRLGMYFNRQPTYRWFGTSVGDYPLPEGMTAADLGKCECAIGIPGNDRAYEIGVAKNPNGKGYFLVWDFWNGGYGLQEVVGEGCKKLKEAYGIEATKLWAKQNRMRVQETRLANGTTKLVVRR